MYDLTTVNCAYNYTHSGKVSNMYSNNVCGPHKCQELHLLCRATHGITSDLHACLLPDAVQSVLLTPIRQTTNMEPLVDYSCQHIKHAHLQA